MYGDEYWNQGSIKGNNLLVKIIIYFLLKPHLFLTFGLGLGEDLSNNA